MKDNVRYRHLSLAPEGDATPMTVEGTRCLVERFYALLRLVKNPALQSCQKASRKKKSRSDSYIASNGIFSDFRLSPQITPKEPT